MNKICNSIFNLQGSQASKQLIMLCCCSASKYAKQPKLRMRTVTPIYPPPGLNLKIPAWDKELFLKRIGGGCFEYADKFKDINEIFTLNQEQLKEKSVPPTIRRYILNIKEKLRRGVLTFEYLERRTSIQVLKKKEEKKKSEAPGGKAPKKAVAGGAGGAAAGGASAAGGAGAGKKK